VLKQVSLFPLIHPFLTPSIFKTTGGHL
jgi:hypothetical protein